MFVLHSEKCKSVEKLSGKMYWMEVRKCADICPLRSSNSECVFVDFTKFDE